MRIPGFLAVFLGLILAAGCGGRRAGIESDAAFGMDLPDGRRISLVMVSQQQGGEIVRWLPDGTPLESIPGGAVDGDLFDTKDGETLYQFVWRLDGDKHPAGNLALVAQPFSTGESSLRSALGGGRYVSNDSVLNMGEAAAVILTSADRLVADPQVGYVSGEIEVTAAVEYADRPYIGQKVERGGKSYTVKNVSGYLGMSQQTLGEGVESLHLPKPITVGDDAILSVTILGDVPPVARLVVKVTDFDGGVHWASMNSVTQNDHSFSAMYRVHNLIAERIKSIEIGEQSIQRIVMDNVSLRPGVITSPKARLAMATEGKASGG